MFQKLPRLVAVAVLVGAMLTAWLCVGCHSLDENKDYDIEHAKQVQMQQKAGGGHGQTNGAPATK